MYATVIKSAVAFFALAPFMAPTLVASAAIDTSSDSQVSLVFYLADRNQQAQDVCKSQTSISCNGMPADHCCMAGPIHNQAMSCVNCPPGSTAATFTRENPTAVCHDPPFNYHIFRDTNDHFCLPAAGLGQSDALVGGSYSFAKTKRDNTTTECAPVQPNSASYIDEDGDVRTIYIAPGQLDTVLDFLVHNDTKSLGMFGKYAGQGYD